MKRKCMVVAAAFCAALMFSSCSDDVFVLANIPFAEFFAEETDSFDVLSSATVKVSNGSLTYGTFHEKADSVENTTFAGITIPIKVSKKALEKSGFTEINAQSPALDLTVATKGKTTTLRYTGKQNLYESNAYSYYVLEETPAYYKEAFLKDGSLTFGKLVGTPQDIGVLYIAQKAAPKHTKGFEYALYTDAGKTALSFDDADTAQVVEGEEISSAKLNTVRAIIATTADGKHYGLTMLKNVWRGSEFGASSDSSLAGKNITALTFVTEKGVYTATSFVLGTSEKIDGKTVVSFADDAQTVSSFVATANFEN